MPVDPSLAEALRDRYLLECEVGRGGMATVYLARDLKHDRKVALKVLHPDLGAALGPERFLREIKAAAGLHHPHILQLHDSGDAEGALYYVMPYVDGESLRDRLRRSGPLGLSEGLRITGEVADALDYAQRHGLVHRDIKPENILLAEGHAHVADFGIAKGVGVAAHAGLTQPGLLVGTPAYMSPEQSAGGEVDARSDQYSLACVTFEMLTGSPLFSGPTPQAVLAQRFRPIPFEAFPRTVSVSMQQVFRKALAVEPSDRFASSSEFAHALDTQSTLAIAGLATPERPTIIVLPLVNMNASPDDEYFSDGMTEDIIAQLSLVRGLRVISRTTAMRYKGMKQSLADIAEELHVSHVVEGSVRRAGARLRIVAQLIDARSDEHLWAETFDRDLTDVFAIQSDVADRITSALRTRLSPEERRRFGHRPTEDMEAYNLYLLARQQNQAKPDGLAKSIEYFERAIDRDPRFARAYGGLAIAYGWYGAGYYGICPRDGYGKATALASKALEIDPDVAEAHVILGKFEEWIRFDWKAAEARFERGLALNPSYAWGHIVYGFHLAAVGRLAEAVEAGQRGVELDPAAPAVRDNAMWFNYWARRYNEALAEIMAAESHLPEDVQILWTHGAVLIALGRAPEAIAPLRELVKRAPITSYSTLLAWGLAAAGQTTEAYELLREIHSRESTEYVWPVGIAWAYARLGQMDRAFEYLERGYEDRAGFMIWISCEPAFDPLRADPRFDAIVRRVGAIAPSSADLPSAV
jgi:eukaryotic-like serine/threonine-protein kinase